MKRTLRRAIRLVAVRVLIAREWLETRATFDPVSSKFAQDPYPFYQRLRERDPVHRSRLFDGWVLSKFSDVDAVLRDHLRFSNDDRSLGETPPDARGDEVHSMLYLDPPDHTRLRSLVTKAFSARSIESLQTRIQQIVDQLLDQAESNGRFDIIEALAYPLPVIVIAEMLGVPPEDRDRFRWWSDDVARILEPRSSQEEVQRAMDSREALMEYFNGIVEQHRKEPMDDLVSALIVAQEEADKLSHEEILVTLLLLLVAGNETTRNLIGNGMLALLRNPDELTRLRANPDLLEPAVEELLRFDSPVQIDSRAVLEDLELHGKPIRKGQRVICLVGSANCDIDVFDQSDRLDFGRESQSHISFGRGIHHCLGASLARLEAQVAFRNLLQRFPQIRLAQKPRYRHRVALRGLESLVVDVERSHDG